MPQTELRESLEKLRREIERLDPGDRQSKERLNALIVDLELKLSQPESQHHDNLIDNVREGIEHFEVEHPRITYILNHIMVTLGNMGI